MKLNNILNYKKYFKKILNYILIFFSLFVGTSFMSGCAAHNSPKFENSGNQKWEDYSGNQKWEDYFDSNEYKPVNENRENLDLKQSIKKAM
jgi:virB7